MKLLQRLNAVLLAALKYGSIAFYVVMLFAASVQILMRFVLKAPLAWTDEVAKYTFVWGTMLGCAYLVHPGKHSSVEVLKDALKGSMKKAHAILLDLICLAFYVIVFMGGITLVQAGLSSVTPALEFPVWIIYLVMPISGI